MANPIQQGDTVVLKSGSPTMTVVLIRSTEEVVCAWFDNNMKPSTFAFPLAALSLKTNV
jgi:uncharacterized protein YodC (DUF2158 family)